MASRRCELLGLSLGDIWVGERPVLIAHSKGGQRQAVPMANRFFAAVGDYLHDEGPRFGTDRSFVVLKGPAGAVPCRPRGWTRS